MIKQVYVNFSHESPRRPGVLQVKVKEPYYTDEPTVMFTQTLEQTEQWESDGISNVYIPLSILKEIVAQL